MFGEEGFQFHGVFGHAFGVLQILIEERQGKIAQPDEGDLGTRATGTAGGDGGEFLVERCGAEATAEGEDAGIFHII